MVFFFNPQNLYYKRHKTIIYPICFNFCNVSSPSEWKNVAQFNTSKLLRSSLDNDKILESQIKNLNSSGLR